MELDSESKDKLAKQPFIIRQAANYVLNILNTLINGGCDEDKITSTMGTLSQNAQGRYSDDDLVNYDNACKILGFSVTNRVGLKRLLDKNGIKQVVINNMKCGFVRSDIMAIRDKLNEDIRKKEKIRKIREKREAIKIRKRENLRNGKI